MRYPESWYYPPGFDYRNDPGLNSFDPELDGEYPFDFEEEEECDD